jgi:hypothetical protein
MMVRKTEDSLKSLPKAPSEDPLSEIMSLLGLFVRDLERHLEGTPEEGGLLQRIRPYQERFRREIKATAPDFRPYEKRYAKSKSAHSPAFLDDDEERADAGDDVRSESSDDIIDDAESEASHDVGQPRLVGTPRTIYVDEVHERAEKYVVPFTWL